MTDNADTEMTNAPHSTESALIETAVSPPSASIGNANAATESGAVKRSAPEGEGVENGVKKVKVEGGAETAEKVERKKGVAPIKPEYLISSAPKEIPDDDAAEAGKSSANGSANIEVVDDRDKPRTKQRGQNKGRKFAFQRDAIQLCTYITGAKTTRKEDVEGLCAYGEKCRQEHDIKVYLKDGKLEDLEGTCPVWELTGTCGGEHGGSGWKCRWLGTHKRDIGDGEWELVVDEEKKTAYEAEMKALKSKRKKVTEYKSEEDGWKNKYEEDTMDRQVINTVDMKYKIMLRGKKYQTKKSDVYLDWMEKTKGEERGKDRENKEGERAAYIEPPLNAAEKRPLYISAETPILAPLTTTGNLPFRRLCVEQGAAVTYSEMAMALPLLQGHKPEWSLLRAHELETPSFGAQICATKPWQAVRATETITDLCPSRGLSFIDLNCGCPIDLVYKAGGGSALLDQQSKLIKMLKGMNYVSGETPITVKIRMGCKDNHPTAQKLVGKLIAEGDVATITLHGRSRQQRYKNAADWSYIAETATLIKNLRKEMAAQTDTAAFKETRDKTRSGVTGDEFGVRFIGNGDCYSGPQYHETLRASGVDGIMIARGALIKPWIFDEIQQNTYLDYSSSQRLDLVSRYAKLGLSHWGSDEFGVGMTRRFLLEWLSFTHRYVPLGLLEVLPPQMNDRPPQFRGRDEMETLLASGDYRDWVKISEMFLGKTGEGFTFVPKHKSNAYDAETQG